MSRSSRWLSPLAIAFALSLPLRWNCTADCASCNTNVSVNSMPTTVSGWQLSGVQVPAGADALAPPAAATAARGSTAEGTPAAPRATATAQTDSPLPSHPYPGRASGDEWVFPPNAVVSAS